MGRKTIKNKAIQVWISVRQDIIDSHGGIDACKEICINALSGKDQQKPKREAPLKVAELESVEKFEPRKYLINTLLIDPTLADDFLKVRKAKDAPLTKTALNGIIAECEKNNIGLSRALQICCEKNWAGFKYSWYVKEELGVVQQKGKIQQHIESAVTSLENIGIDYKDYSHIQI